MIKILKGNIKKGKAKSENSTKGIESLKLPMSKSTPSHVLQDYSILIYGQKKNRQE